MRWFELEWAFLEGYLASSLRRVRLRSRSVREVQALLIADGFACASRNVPAERATDGAMLWLRRDGGITRDAGDAELLRSLVFAHCDGGLVEVFPHGDGVSRLRPPWARKYVLRRAAWPLVSSAGLADDATRLANRAFAVSDEGEIAPLSHRAEHVCLYDQADPVDSWRFATEGVVASVVALAPDDAPRDLP